MLKRNNLENLTSSDQVIRIWLIPMLLLALAVLTYSIFPSIGLTYDSRLYLDLADNLASDGFNQIGFGSKPPLFPMMIFVFGANPMLLAVLGILCWLASFFLLNSMLTNELSTPFYRIGLLIAILFGTPIFLVHNFLWTEPYFHLIVFSTLWLVYKKEGISWKYWFVITILMLLLVGLKHLGIAVVAAFIFILIDAKKDWRATLLSATPSLIFFTFWQVKSRSLRGNFSRLDHTDGLDLGRNLDYIGETVFHWIYPFDSVPLINVTVAILSLLFFLYLILFRKGIVRGFSALTISLLLVLFTKGDLVFPEDVERYLAVVYPFFVFYAFKSVEGMPLKYAIAVKLITILFVLYTLIRTFKNVFLWHA